MFTYHTKETAAAESQAQIGVSLKTFRFLPKLHQLLAEAPITYEIYNSAWPPCTNVRRCHPSSRKPS